jgi:hypothetical protein
MTLKELGQTIASGDSPEVEIHAIDLMIYLVYSVTGERKTPLHDARGQTQKFPSRYAAQRALQDAGVATATFVHRSAYGEMIGTEGSIADTELRETIELAEPEGGC